MAICPAPDCQILCKFGPIKATFSSLAVLTLIKMAEILGNKYVKKGQQHQTDKQ